MTKIKVDIFHGATTLQTCVGLESSMVHVCFWDVNLENIKRLCLLPCDNMSPPYVSTCTTATTSQPHYKPKLVSASYYRRILSQNDSPAMAINSSPHNY